MSSTRKLTENGRLRTRICVLWQCSNQKTRKHSRRHGMSIRSALAAKSSRLTSQLTSTGTRSLPSLVHPSVIMTEHSSALPSLASKAPCDGADAIISSQCPNVSLATMLMVDPVEEALEQTSKCGFEPVGVRLAAAPVSFISRLKHQRRDALDYDKIPSYDRIGPQNSGIPYRTLPSSCKWIPHIHPEGSVYFQQEGWFTNLWLYDEENLRDIDATLELVSRELCRLRMSPGRYEICLDVDVTMDEKTREKVKLGCYYVWDKDTEEVFWLQDTPSSFYDGIDVKIMGREHLKQAGGIGYWDHVYMFPHGRTLAVDQLHYLRSVITYLLFDKTTGKVSTAPYSRNDLREFLVILKEIEEVMRGDSEQQARPEHMVIVSRLRKTLCRARVAHFYGERCAQLDSDRGVYEYGQRERRSIPFAILAWMFFFTPEIYLVQLSAVLVDGKFNHDNWKTLITQLQDDWMASITPSAVILSAGVGFLSIQSVDVQGPGTTATYRSVGQVACYMSVILSIGSILAGTILARQHRAGMHYSEDAAQYLLPLPSSGVQRASPPEDELCIEKLAILFSIPMTLFLWGLLTFFIAISWLCFHESDTGTRAMVAVTIAISVATLVGIVPGVYRHQSKHITNSLAHNSLEWLGTLTKGARRYQFVRFARRWLGPS